MDRAKEEDSSVNEEMIVKLPVANNADEICVKEGIIASRSGLKLINNIWRACFKEPN